jgi:hypothetical protein
MEEPPQERCGSIVSCFAEQRIRWNGKRYLSRSKDSAEEAGDVLMMQAALAGFWKKPAPNWKRVYQSLGSDRGSLGSRGEHEERG